MAQTLGLARVIWNGTEVPIEKGGTMKDGGLEAKPVITGTTVDSANEMVAGEVNVTTKVVRGLAVTRFYNGQAGELQVICDTGQSFVWPDAFVGKTAEISFGDGGKQKVSWVVGQSTELQNG